MRRVSTTIPGYWEAAYDKAFNASGLDSAEFVRTALYEYVHKTRSSQDGRVSKSDRGSSTEVSERDLHMMSAPERLRQLFSDQGDQVCVRGQEIGEDHIIEPGDLFSWFKFGRDSQPSDWVKNGKLCKDCHTVAKEMWNSGERYF